MNSFGSESSLFDKISQLIEQNKRIVASHANSTLTLMFWQIGRLVNGAILQNERAEYGKRIVVTLSRKLSEKHGSNFEEKKLAENAPICRTIS